MILVINNLIWTLLTVQLSSFDYFRVFAGYFFPDMLVLAPRPSGLLEWGHRITLYFLSRMTRLSVLVCESSLRESPPPPKKDKQTLQIFIQAVVSLTQLNETLSKNILSIQTR